MQKRVILVSLIAFGIAFSPIAALGNQPPLPPEIEMLVCTTFYDEGHELIVNQFVHDASLCGIKVNLVFLEHMEIVMRILSKDFEVIMFISIAQVLDDPIESLINLLWLHFGLDNFWNFEDPLLQSKISEMSDYFYIYGDLESAINVFHEIEWMIYEREPLNTIGYRFAYGLVYTYHLLFNNAIESPVNDFAMRRAFSYLLDREFFIEVMQETYPDTSYIASHMFGWSQYHDPNLPELTYSIGKATSTLAKAGYRPARIKV